MLLTIIDLQQSRTGHAAKGVDSHALEEARVFWEGFCDHQSAQLLCSPGQGTVSQRTEALGGCHLLISSYVYRPLSNTSFECVLFFRQKVQSATEVVVFICKEYGNIMHVIYSIL